MKVLGLPFKENLIPFGQPGDWARFQNILPSGKVPCLQDGNTLVWDSLSIAEYLFEKNPKVWPQDKSARAWARSSAAEMHSGFQSLRNVCGMNCGVRSTLSDSARLSVQGDIALIDQLWTQGLNTFKGPFLAGHQFSAVDAFFAPIALRWQTYDLKFSVQSTEYIKMILGLDAMKSWYEAALLEEWRDLAHDQDLVKFGKVTTDLRKVK